MFKKLLPLLCGAVLTSCATMPTESVDHVSLAAGEDQTEAFHAAEIEAPIGSQEVWAAGVTYYRSRSARMAESQDAGGGSFYDRVYSAERPELFFKATPSRVAAPGSPVRSTSAALVRAMAA